MVIVLHVSRESPRLVFVERRCTPIHSVKTSISPVVKLVANNYHVVTNVLRLVMLLESVSSVLRITWRKDVDKDVVKKDKSVITNVMQNVIQIKSAQIHCVMPKSVSIVNVEPNGLKLFASLTLKDLQSNVIPDAGKSKETQELPMHLELMKTSWQIGPQSNLSITLKKHWNLPEAISISSRN